MDSAKKCVVGASIGVYALLAWFAGIWLHLAGSSLWVLRGALAAIGIAGAGAILWWSRLRNARQKGSGAPAGQTAATSQGADEIDFLIREAESRLRSSKLRMGNLPAIFLVGESGSGKTNTVVKSGLDAELLAGQVSGDTPIIPTRSINVWFARQTIFVETGSALLAEPARWARLIARLAPGKLQSILGRRTQAPRAALVCFDGGNFAKPGGAQAAAAAVRSLHTRLGEFSQALGISFPVYVLFNKMDLLPFFGDYVGNLTKAEAAEVFGVTLPIQSGYSTGVYAEQETNRLGAAFDNLFYSLSDKRVEFLRREHDAAKLPGIYEFPREFRKLRNVLVQLLVDLCRPSQLRTGPFLRGFYFAGLRNEIVDAVAAVAAEARPATQEPFVAPAGATGVFDVRQLQRPAAGPPAETPAGATRVFDVRKITGEGTFMGGGPAQVSETRQVAIFLSHLFSDLLLQDRAALGASAASTKVNFWRRLLLASAAALFLICSIGFIVSYFGNRELESKARRAAQGIPPSEASGSQLPSVVGLQHLDNLRQSLSVLSQYEREGAPWRLRWGLYVGSDLYPEVHRIYFDRFRQLLLAQTQTALVASLKRLPSNPGLKGEYEPPYNTLKAYVITTTCPEKSTREFLTPILLAKWKEGRPADPDRERLARMQFDFYSAELKIADPFSAENSRLILSDNHKMVVSRSRAYLAGFGDINRVYQSMLNTASTENKSINFNRDFPGSEEVVVNKQEVLGGYTKAGWASVQDAMKRPVVAGEDCVLGPQAAAGVSTANLGQQLQTKYRENFVRQWHDFLKKTKVVDYNNPQDAATKLATLSATQSPLLGLMCVVSQNTLVEAQDIARIFQPAQSVVDAGCQDNYISRTNNYDYVKALLDLEASLEQFANVANGPPEQKEAAKKAVLDEVQSAKKITRQMATNFKIVHEAADIAPTVQDLLEKPITSVESLFRPRPPAPPDAGQLCGQFRDLMAKYPFNPRASIQATIEDVNRIFRPGDGALWAFYDQSLKNILQKQGSQYLPKPDGITVGPRFLELFNRAAALSDALYPGGSQQPKLTYSLNSNLAGTNESITLIIDNQSFSNSAGRNASKHVTWPGSPPGVSLTVRFGNEDFRWPTYDGIWGAFEFFADAEKKSQVSSSIYRLEWTLRTGQSRRPVTTASGQPVSVQFDLDMMGVPPLFNPGYFSSLHCTSKVVQ